MKNENNSLRLNKAEEIKAGSIAIPSLASGMFGFPKDVTARVIIKKIFEYQNPLLFFNESILDIWKV